MKKLEVLVIGAGMYVCGRGTSGEGVILPSLIQCWKNGIVNRIHIVSNSENGLKELSSKISALKQRFCELPEISISSLEGGGDIASVGKQFPSFDVAIVSTPNHTHFEIVKKLIGQKINCLVVKPLVTKTKEAEELFNLAEKNGVYHGVEYHKRYDRANLKLRDLFRADKIGDSLYWLIEYSQRKVIPEKVFSSWVNQTNIFEYLMVHYVDMISYITGAVPIRAMQVSQSKYLLSKGINTPDSIQAQIEWRKPQGDVFNSMLIANWIDSNNSTAMSDQKIKVIGTKGRIESDQKNRGFELVDENGTEHINPDFFQFYKSDDGFEVVDGYGFLSIKQFMEDVLDIKNGIKSRDHLLEIRHSFKASIQIAKILESLEKSEKNKGSWIDVAE